MASARSILVALLSLVPAGALAHGPNGHPADPNLHVDPSLEDCSVIFSAGLTQDAFRRFTREFGSVSAFKPTAPPTTLGRRGVAIAIEQLSFTVEERSDAWNDTWAHPDAYHELGSQKDIPKLRLRVGVADRVDLGAFYTRNPWANYGWLGLEARYGVLQQGQTTPVSLAVRGAYTRTLYVDDMDMHAFTADVAAGRTFWNAFTPYLDLGADVVLARETSDVVALQSEAHLVPRLTGGFEVRYWHIGLGAEAHLSELSSFQFQVSALF